MRTHLPLIVISVLLSCASLSAQEAPSINISTKESAGIIDSKIYGQLFEHIYFSANNGVWQELINERSFEPEEFPGIHPRDGFFDGWYMDDKDVLHSPTRYEQPIEIAKVDAQNYDIDADVNWRSYKLDRRMWSGGLMDIRLACKNKADGTPYFFRIHDPYYEARLANAGQTQAQMEAFRAATARQQAQTELSVANFSLDVQAEREVNMFGQTRKVVTLSPLVYKVAATGQIDESQTWHKLRLSVRGNKVTAYWDGKKLFTKSSLDNVSANDITFWVNYTEAMFRNIRVSSPDGSKIWFQGTPKDVQTPSVAQQWSSFGKGTFSLVKGDAVNMNYSQKIDASNGVSGVFQGPQNVVEGNKFVGSLYARGDGSATLSVRLSAPGTIAAGTSAGPSAGTGAAGSSAVRPSGGVLAESSLGKPGAEWKRYDFTLDAGSYSGDADFCVVADGGTLQIDQVSLTTKAGIDLGGFRPDIYKAVKELGPTCLRWPGGGYAAQYDWRWGIGDQSKRTRWAHWQWLDYDQNCFGTDEFISFCRNLNSEPVMVVSVGFERPASDYQNLIQNAADWVAYCNEPASGKWGSVRAANGHPEPYNVKYWEIDNEMWEMGIEKYEAAVRKFSRALREIDPTIKIIACGGFREDNDFINRSGNYFDYLSLHHYEVASGYESGPKKLQEQYLKYADVIANSPNPNIKLFISEWNLNSTDWKTGLFAGGFLNMCEKTPVVELGAAALFIRRTDAPDWNNAFINFDYKDLFVEPNYQVTKLWQDNFSKYRLEYSGNTGNLNIVATMIENGSGVIVKIVNATDKEKTLTINGDWKKISNATYKYYAPGSLTAANSMENKDAVSLKEKDIAPSGNSLKLTVAPLSAGVMIIKY